MNSRIIAVAALGFAIGGCGPSTPPPAGTAPAAKTAAAVDAARLIGADTEPGNWMAPGRTYGEQHFSPLNKIDADNVKGLGLAWYYDLDVAHRAQEATPLVIDGVMYITGAWSKVFALDAKTGAPLWTYDPKVPGQVGVNACCDTVNRGVAAWKGRVYLGTLDGRLIALDAASGKPVWQVATVPGGARYTITGAPRVVKGMVLIGNGGAEMGMRGYVSAYDADTGRQIWRFYTVPGDPSKPFESPALEKAARTWSGEWWTLGGGGPVWDSMAYDPALDLIYIGVGNGTPWNRSKVQGDSLYLTSIVALKAATGEYVWHYQTTPGDEWDYDACSPLILADLTIDGAKRGVIMQAPKNGFFYVLDRATGELLSADPYVVTNWAKSVDSKTGRPVIESAARYSENGKPFVAMPGPGGGHSWQPMSFSPVTQQLYMPVTELSFPFIPEKSATLHQLAWNTGVDFNAGSLPQDAKIKALIKSGLRVISRHGIRWRAKKYGASSWGVLGTAEWCRPRAILCFRETAWASSLPTAPIAASGSGPPRPRRAFWRRPSPTWSTAINTWPSKWAGAVPLALPPANSRAIRTLHRTCRGCWSTSWAVALHCRHCRRRCRPFSILRRIRPSRPWWRRARPCITRSAPAVTATARRVRGCCRTCATPA